MHTKIILLGAGLTGLTLGYFLEKENIPFLILEARERIGGRIKTLYGDDGKSIEMGATWFGKKHQNLNKLLRELNIGYFPQHTSGISLFENFSFAPPQKFEMPQTEEDQSFRIKNGSFNLIEKLSRKINPEKIKLNKTATHLFLKNNKIEIKTDKGETYTCDKLISTLPPRLLSQTINFEPGLPENIKTICDQTHTWMGESIKFSLEYKNAFWRNKNYSGAAFSQASVCSEMHDHCDENVSFFALKGFLNPSSAQMTQGERKELLIAQLFKFFGKEAKEYTTYHESIWSKEKFTYIPYDGYIRAHQNNGHSIFKEYIFGNKFRIAGSETAEHFPGYMEGAVGSALEVFGELKNDR